MSEFNMPYTKHEVTPDDVQSVVEVLNSEIFTNGPSLQNFEDMFAAQVEAPYAVGVSSGTAGLHLAVEALGTKPEQKVIVPSLTFVATANAVLYGGSAVEFVDIDPKTLPIDIDQVESHIAANPKQYAGVIAGDFAGYPLDTRSISEICKRYDTWLIEDAVHALGAVSKNRGDEDPVGKGRFADAVVFSFHPAKHITTGEGGMVTTRDVILGENEDLAHTKQYYEEALSIPMYATLSTDEQAHVIRELKDLTH